MRAALLALSFVCLALPATASIVTGIIDSTTLQIDLTQKIRIANILVPPQMAMQASTQLRDVLLQQPVTITDSRTDMTGIASGIVQRVNGDDLAETLVGHGLALVWPLQGREDLTIVKLLAVEAAARTRKIGLWADPTSVVTPESAGKHLNSYSIVEGTVTGVASIKGRYYINFGANPNSDWKTDFTAQLSKDVVNRLLLPPYKINWADLTGKRVRVRGWVEARNGPMLTITMPAQLELIK